MHFEKSVRIFIQKSISVLH